MARDRVIEDVLYLVGHFTLLGIRSDRKSEHPDLSNLYTCALDTIYRYVIVLQDLVNRQ
jgi:hypothetical protein